MSPIGPLFDTPSNRVLEAASSSLRPVLRRLLDEPPVDDAVLRDEVRRHLSFIEEAADAQEFLDLAAARRVAAQCLALLKETDPSSSAEAKRLARLAARYFITHDDVEHDIHSPIGLDDDAEVVALVARELGRQDVMDMNAEEDG